jgi:Sec-independent protein secretion pathway component TatC
MKTLFVVSEKRVNEHVGEEYDDILEVEHQPTTETIQEWGNRVKDRIRALWHEQVKAGTSDMKVAVTLDAASPFNAMLLNLRIIMKAEEGIVVELPYLSQEMWDRVERGVVSDPEAQDMLNRLDRK